MKKSVFISLVLLISLWIPATFAANDYCSNKRAQCNLWEYYLRCQDCYGECEETGVWPCQDYSVEHHSKKRSCFFGLTSCLATVKDIKQFFNCLSCEKSCLHTGHWSCNENNANHIDCDKEKRACRQHGGSKKDCEECKEYCEQTNQPCFTPGPFPPSQ